MTDVSTNPDDQRVFYPNKPAAIAVANNLQRAFTDQGCYSAIPQFEPNKGFVVVLFCKNNIPEAWEMGAEVNTEQMTMRKTPPDWASKKKKAAPTVPTGDGSTPVPTKPRKAGATAKVWEIADVVLTEVGSEDIKALRAAIMDACITDGINKATAGTQYSKWKKAKNI